MKPLILFSLPRSGSTLLQRVLAADHQIASVSEPWLLLPPAYALKKKGSSAEYSHLIANIALQDFIRELPNGEDDYLSAIGGAATELYRKAAKDKEASYFLDKTPRYALIADDVLKMFPDGKFIVLWRNPLSIIASMVEFWSAGKWDLFRFNVDLFNGLESLIDSYRNNPGKYLAIQNERFLKQPEKELERISNYLEIEIDVGSLKRHSQVHLDGKMGDTFGINNYQAVDVAPLQKWKKTINNPLRKRWSRNYLNWIGKERLEIMGYDLNELLREIEATEMTTKNLFADLKCKVFPQSKYD